MVKLLFLLCCLGNVILGQNENGDCWSSSRTDQAKWWPNGSTIDKGQYWFTCKQGKLVPSGCLDDNLKRIDIGKTIERDTFEMECILKDEGYLGFKSVACLPVEGGKYIAGGSWNERNNVFWFKCEKTDDGVRISIGGCIVTSTGEKIDAGAEYVQDIYWWKCKNPSPTSSMRLCPAGCVVDGKKYLFGESGINFRCEKRGIIKTGGAPGSTP